MKKNYIQDGCELVRSIIQEIKKPQPLFVWPFKQHQIFENVAYILFISKWPKPNASPAL